MNRSFSTSSLFALVVSVVLSYSIAAQNSELHPAIACMATTDLEKEVQRTPRATFIRDETGAAAYTIKGNDSWRRTEVEVKRGQKIEVSASGMVRWAIDGIEKIDVTPDGTRPPYRDGWNYKHFPFPEAGIGSLVMRIGKGVYPAGSAAVIEAEDDGFVELMVNDDVLSDNSGFFLVSLLLRSGADLSSR
jgi:hypothetical protein